MAHYFTNEKIKSNRVTTKCMIKNKEYTFITDNGVFSKKGLDFGTRTLLDNIPIDEIKGDVLDVGCGYGPIGIFVKDNCDCSIDMIDINERALKLAKENALLNKVSINIFNSNIYDNISKKYNYIISNPPIRVGKEILYKILFGAKAYLKEKGHLIIVINKDQGAKSTVKDLEKEYKVKIIVKNKGFFVIDCQNC